MDLTLWHNPRCSKSRQALAILTEQGMPPTVRLYLKEPPDAAELSALLATLKLPAHALLRTGEKIYKDLGLSETTPQDALIAAMAEHPILIERPVLITDAGAVIARPPERVLELMNPEIR